MSTYRRKVIVWTLVLMLISPVLCVSFGGPYGSYLIFKIFYPYAMLVASKNHKITSLAIWIWIALLQFPIYGGLLILAQKYKKNQLLFLFVLTITHAIFVIIALDFVEGFG